MLINSHIDNWDGLIKFLQIEDETQEVCIQKILNWCQQNIKSTFTHPNLKELRQLFQVYMQLNSTDNLTTLIRSELGYTVAHKAAKLGFDRFLDLTLIACSESQKKQILEAETLKGNRPLHLAAVNGDINTVEVLVDDHNADINLLNYNKRTALDLAAQCASNQNTLSCVPFLLIHTRTDNLTSSLLFDLIAFDAPDLLDTVIKRNPALTEQRDELGQNLLHKAIITNCHKAVDYLFGMSGLIHQQTGNESNVLHLACRYGTADLIRKILYESSFSADFVTAKDSRGLTPIDYLEQRYGLETVLAELKETSRDSMQAQSSRTQLI